MVAQNSCGCWCRHHIIRCSHKRCKNRHFNQHMIFRYCIEGSGEPLQMCILPRAFAASTRDLDIYYIVQRLPAQMCRLTRVFAAGVNSTHFRQHKRFCTVTKAKVSLCKCADSPDPSLLAQNGIQSPFESPHENFKL